MGSRSHTEATVEMFRREPDMALRLLTDVLNDGTKEELKIVIKQITLAFGDNLPRGLSKASLVDKGKAIARELREIVEESEKNRPKAAQARHKINLSQSEFANMLGISVRTLQQWEQGRREPTGAARTLLTAAATHPKELLKALGR